MSRYTEHINGEPHCLIMDGSVYSKEQTDTTLDENAAELTKILNKNHHCVGKVKDLLTRKLCPSGEIEHYMGYKKLILHPSL